LTARLNIGANALDVGLGLKFDNSDGVTDDGKFQFSVSGFFLGHLHDFGPVDTYFTAGGVAYKTDEASKNFHLDAFVGFQPEITLLEHIAVSTRAGLSIPLVPAFVLQTAGAGISIVQGANFKILF
jgi:hypothetical protein